MVRAMPAKQQACEGETRALYKGRVGQRHQNRRRAVVQFVVPRFIGAAARPHESSPYKANGTNTRPFRFVDRITAIRWHGSERARRFSSHAAPFKEKPQ